MNKIQTKGCIESFDHLCARMDASEKVYFLRYGDGEVRAMMGEDCPWFKTSEGLVKELNESFVIDHPDYLLALGINMPFEPGMSKGVFAPYNDNDELEGFLLEKGLIKPDKTFENQIFFHYLSVFDSELMFNFFEKYIRPKRKVFIGCTPKDTAEKLYGHIDYYINIPPKNAYDSIDSWWPELLSSISSVDLVIPSAGAASNVIGKRLWELDKRVHVIDVGSIIDAVEGNTTRKWIKLVGHRIQKVLPPEHRDRRTFAAVHNGLKDLRYFARLALKNRSYYRRQNSTGAAK